MREPAFWYRPASWKSHLLKPLAALYGAVAAHRLIPARGSTREALARTLLAEVPVS